MLTVLNSDQVRFVALLARTARSERDATLGNVAEEDLGGPLPGRGEHNPAAELGLEAVPEMPPAVSLREAITSLSNEGRAELHALMRIGQGDLAAGNWHRGLTQAANLGDETVTASLVEDPDLHDHLMKGLFEADAGG